MLLKNDELLPLFERLCVDVGSNEIFVYHILKAFPYGLDSNSGELKIGSGKYFIENPTKRPIFHTASLYIAGKSALTRMRNHQAQ